MDLSWVDLGTVPAWVSAIGSTVALTATAHIITRDRRERQRTDAYGVACWIDELDDSAVLRVKNTSARPIFDVRYITWWAHSRGRREEAQHVEAVLKAQEGENEASLVLPPLEDDDEFLWYSRAVTFRDADGRTWLRDLDNQTLYRRYQLVKADRGVERFPAPWRTPRSDAVDAAWEELAARRRKRRRQ